MIPCLFWLLRPFLEVSEKKKDELASTRPICFAAGKNIRFFSHILDLAELLRRRKKGNRFLTFRFPFKMAALSSLQFSGDLLNENVLSH